MIYKEILEKYRKEDSARNIDDALYLDSAMEELLKEIRFPSINKTRITGRLKNLDKLKIDIEAAKVSSS